jgi:hypothetical protein
MLKNRRGSWLVVVALLHCCVFTACGEKLSITTTALPDATLGVAYSFQMQGKSVDSWALNQGSLPPGIGLNQGGLLSGTPSARGTFNFTVSAVQSSTTGPSSSVSQGLALNVR